MGTPQFAVPSLAALVRAGFDVSTVVTRPDRPAGRGRKVTPPPVKLEAQSLGLSVFQPEKLTDQTTLMALAERSPEVIVVCAFGQILRPPVLGIPSRGVLNIHPSLLPRYRGATPIQSAILAGDELTGVTIILMDAGLDSGPILSQTSLPITDDDSAGSLEEKLSQAAAALLVETLPRWLAGAVTPEPQDEAQATMSRRLTKEDAEMDWSLAAPELQRRVRAFNPWPGAYTYVEGQTLRVLESRVVPNDSGQPAGTVVAPPHGGASRGFAVQTGDGLLAVLAAQRAGHKVLPAEDLLRGMPQLMGKRLPERG